MKKYATLYNKRKYFLHNDFSSRRINQMCNCHCHFIYVARELFSINNTLSNLNDCCPKINHSDVRKFIFDILLVSR